MGEIKVMSEGIRSKTPISFHKKTFDDQPILDLD
jgi:hypothetical protein